MRDITCIGLTAEEMAAALAFYPGMEPNTIPAGTYNCNQDRDLQAFGYIMAYIANAGLPNEIVYNLLWAIYRDGGETINNYHPQNAGWDYISFNARADQQTSPWHPGARMYWEARGLTLPPQLPPPAPWLDPAGVPLPGASVAVTPSTAAPGSNVTVTGAGFNPGSAALVEVDGLYVSGAVATTIAISPESLLFGANGTFQFTATLPGNSTAGLKTLRAIDFYGTIATTSLTIQ